MQEKLIQQMSLFKIEDGGTKLHWALSHLDSVALADYLDSEVRESLMKFCKTTNDRGDLPLDVALKNKLDGTIIEKLSLLTMEHSLIPLSALIDKNKILKGYKPNTALYNNLELGCSIANKVRIRIKQSSTHPDMNEESKRKQVEVIQAIHDIRKDIPHNDLLAYWKMIIFTNPVDLLFNFHDIYLNENTKLFIENGVGNCGEMAYIAYRYVRELNRQIITKVCFLHGGDHVFLTIGDKKNRVVCDPWAGDVYPFEEIPFKLHGFKQYRTLGNTNLNILPSYNPRFHILSEASKHNYAFLFTTILLSPIILLVGVSIHLGLALMSVYYGSIAEPKSELNDSTQLGFIS